MKNNEIWVQVEQLRANGVRYLMAWTDEVRANSILRHSVHWNTIGGHKDQKAQQVTEFTDISRFIDIHESGTPFIATFNDSGKVISLSLNPS